MNGTRGKSLDFTQDELRRLLAVLDAPEEMGFVALARVGGVNPAKAFRSANLRDIDFGEDDIAGFNFSGAQLDGCDLSRVKNLAKAYFDDRCALEGVKLPEGMTIEDLRRQCMPGT